MTQDVIAPARPHGPIEEVLPGLHVVTGTVRMAPLMSFSRMMTIVVQGERLVLVNSLRLGDAGLAALDALGTVTDVIRLAGFHGIDDPFYKERYGARVWVVKGMSYQRGFAASKTTADPYFRADEEMDQSTTLPIEGARLYLFGTTPPEALLHLDRDGGVVVSGDCLQNITGPDEFFSLLARPVMRMMGFFRPHNLGPGWLKSAKPTADRVGGILDLDFQHVLPVHGTPVIGDAKALYRPAIEAFMRA